MCVFCAEIQKQNMTTREVARAYVEFRIPEGHADELHTVIEKNCGRDEFLNELLKVEAEILKGEYS